MEAAREFLPRIIDDRDAAWKFVSLLFHGEIHSLVTEEATRESDVVGIWPRWVGVALGEEFVPRGALLAAYRGKFGEEEGKTVFETRMVFGGFAVDVGLDYLWEDLQGEVRRRGDSKGPVTLALREALGRTDMDRRFLIILAEEVGRRVLRGACRRRQQEEVKEEESPVAVAVVGGGAKVGGVMAWITKDLQWDSTFTHAESLRDLPLLLRHHPNVDHAHMAAILQVDTHHLNSHRALQSLIVVSHDDNHAPSKLFAPLRVFLRWNVDGRVPPEWLLIVRLFLDATREQIAAASSANLAGDVFCVGGVALALLQHQRPAIPPKKKTWEVILSDVIEFTPCCSVPAILQQLRLQLEGNKEKLLKEVLTSEQVFAELSSRFQRKSEEHDDTCGVRNILAFYFSVFGLNLEWMGMIGGVAAVGAEKWALVGGLPVEISSALQTDPHWAHPLLPQLKEMLREHMQKKRIVSVALVAEKFNYETEADWLELLPLIDGAALRPGGRGWVGYCGPSPSLVAPLFRALLKLYGVEWAKARITKQLWSQIPASGDYSAGSLGSLLHSAITLGRLEEVKRRCWPGLLKWRNAEGKSALEVAIGTHGEDHPIRILVERLSTKLPPSPQD